jgi:uncharacterized protein YeaO (DUF488 family)
MLTILRLGTARLPDEGLRIGTVRRPPRGDWYDVWYPNLAPSLELMKLGQGATTEHQWAAFARAFRSEMARPEASRTLDLLAALSHQTHFSLGCYCEDEARCHRSILRELLHARGALIAPG